MTQQNPTRVGTYLPRIVDDELDELHDHVPAVALEGARATGKTRTALRRARTTWMLDDPQTLELVVADGSRVLEGRPPVLIDDWQRYPPIWDLVRRAVDSGAPAGTFILTGSAEPAAAGTHSGAGRIVTVRMRPMTLTERQLAAPTVSLAELLRGERRPLSGSTDFGLDTYVEEILRSGFPGIRHLESMRAVRGHLSGYVENLIDHDFESAGVRLRNRAAVRRWIAAYAAATGTTASYEKIRDAATSGEGEKPAKTTVMPYRDVLERLWLIDAIPGWTPTGTELRRLTQSPKHYLADAALAARLTNQTRESLLSVYEVAAPGRGPFLGALFESLLALDVSVYAQANEATVHHLRTFRGEHEVDFIVTGPDGKVVALEVKLSATVGDADVAHLRWLREVLGDRLADAAVVTTGSFAYRRDDGIAVIPAVLLGP